MINKIKNIKFYILQYKYKHITDIILRLQKHVDFLFLNNFINFLQKNHILNNNECILSTSQKKNERQTFHPYYSFYNMQSFHLKV